jgi:glycosyltransferase involved in cell wall biosynthesis
MISIICPFYNEAAVIEAAIRRMLANLAFFDRPWELIVVNDGSTDDSFELARAIERENPNLRVIGYANNRGRGYALRTGIAAARGDIVVTTEVDCSWGDDIAQRIVRIFDQFPNTDMVIASPNLAGGGYANVPMSRVLISRLGNALIRIALSSRITMYTGMTRGYRRKRFLELPIDEDEKEFHLEVARKALAFGFVIREVPARLTWQHGKLAKPGAAKRKSSSRVRKLMRTHLVFSAFAAPIRYFLIIVAALATPALGFFIAAVYNLFTPQPSAFYLLTSLSLFLVALIVLLMALLTHQNTATQMEIWRLRSELRALGTETQMPSPPVEPSSSLSPDEMVKY